MSSVQYFHDQVHGKTYAVDVSFNREDLLECIHHFDQDIAFNIGVSFLHPNDVYDRKVGREVSQKKLLPQMLRLQSVAKDYENAERLYLTFEDQVSMLYYKFRVNSRSDKPHFVEVS